MPRNLGQGHSPTNLVKLDDLLTTFITERLPLSSSRSRDCIIGF
jgi:hypothetical protein